MSWLANLVQSPRDKPGSALVLVSKQGAGKGRVIDFLTDYVFNDKTCKTLQGMEKLTSRFNSHLSGLLLAGVDELASARDSFRNNFDELKGRITGNTIGIERKGLDISTFERDYARYIFMSNHDDSMYIEDGDRRYGIFACSNRYTGGAPDTVEYFTELTRSFNQNVGNHFFTYLLQYEIPSDVNLRYPPMTDMKARMQNASKPNVLKWLDEFKSADYEIIEKFDNDLQAMIDKSVYTSKWLFSEYMAWCRVENIVCKVSLTGGFTKALTKELGEATRVVLSGTRVRGFSIQRGSTTE